MDHGVGKLDCIQKLCKNLEDCEQRIHELEATNSELRAEHEDMEEEAKYLKYVLSYRGDVMKAQLQNEYETKMAALKDELAKSKRSETSRSDVALTKRNRTLEEEVTNILTFMIATSKQIMLNVSIKYICHQTQGQYLKWAVLLL
jgi:predicted RNase H-like nuclease (RuvC/YqgF family)